MMLIGKYKITDVLLVIKMIIQILHKNMPYCQHTESQWSQKTSHCDKVINLTIAKM